MESAESVAALSLTVLGSGTCVPSTERYPAGYLLSTAEPWLLDVGPPALQRLAATGTSYRDVARVFVSHAHPDHIGGLIPLIQALNHTPGFTRTQPLFVYGSAPVREQLERNMRDELGVVPKFPYHFVTVEGDVSMEGQGWLLRSKPMKHPAGAQGLRLDMGAVSLVYSGDTGPCPEIVELAAEADLLVLECCFPRDKPSERHLTTFQAGQIGREARVKKLLLSHFYPEVAAMSPEAREEEVRAGGYEGELVFGEDLLRVAL